MLSQRFRCGPRRWGGWCGPPPTEPRETRAISCDWRSRHDTCGLRKPGRRRRRLVRSRLPTPEPMRPARFPPPQEAGRARLTGVSRPEHRWEPRQLSLRGTSRDGWNEGLTAANVSHWLPPRSHYPCPPARGWGRGRALWPPPRRTPWLRANRASSSFPIIGTRNSSNTPSPPSCTPELSTRTVFCALTLVSRVALGSATTSAPPLAERTSSSETGRSSMRRLTGSGLSHCGTMATLFTPNHSHRTFTRVTPPSSDRNNPVPP